VIELMVVVAIKFPPSTAEGMPDILGQAGAPGVLEAPM
jgi:hypothetical protein